MLYERVFVYYRRFRAGLATRIDECTTICTKNASKKMTTRSKLFQYVHYVCTGNAFVFGAIMMVLYRYYVLHENN
jgi:hypothetical protein